MICYFSATGNSKHVAELIADSLGDRAVSVEGLDPRIGLSDGEMFGIVTPVYCWELPLPTQEFLGSVTFDRDPSYTFLIVTYGTVTGCCSEQAGMILRKKGVPLDASYSVRMPDTWTPMFDLSDREAMDR